MIVLIKNSIKPNKVDVFDFKNIKTPIVYFIIYYQLLLSYPVLQLTQVSPICILNIFNHVFIG